MKYCSYYSSGSSGNLGIRGSGSEVLSDENNSNIIHCDRKCSLPISVSRSASSWWGGWGSRCRVIWLSTTLGWCSTPSSSLAPSIDFCQGSDEPTFGLTLDEHCCNQIVVFAGRLSWRSCTDFWGWLVWPHAQLGEVGMLQIWAATFSFSK